MLKKYSSQPTHVLLHFSPSNLLRLVSHQLDRPLSGSCACIASLSHVFSVIVILYKNYPKWQIKHLSMRQKVITCELDGAISQPSKEPGHERAETIYATRGCGETGGKVEDAEVVVLIFLKQFDRKINSNIVTIEDSDWHLIKTRLRLKFLLLFDCFDMM